MDERSSRGPSRRMVLGAATVGTAASLAPTRADVAVRPARTNLATPPSGKVRHMANRFGYGVTPGLAKQMNRAGGPEAWFRAQLSPASISDPFTADLTSWWTSLTASAQEIWARNQAEIEPGWNAMANYARSCLLRRMYSKRQVLESMTEFWENFLYVPVWDDGVFPYRTQYGAMVRENALGSFEELLHSAITHPAMGISLDNAQSSKRGINENLGRELLELFTVGQGQYSEQDVKDSARILTGFRVDTWRTWESTYEPSWHYVGPVRVMAFTHPNADPDGRETARAYLKYLAHHPATAQRVAHRLCVRFVQDDPPAGLVSRLAKTYLEAGTQIKPVLQALVASSEFWASAGKKTRTPTDDLIATYRVLDRRVQRPRSDSSCANSILWQSSSLGAMPFDWPRPDGPPDSAAAWVSVSRLMASFEHHWGMAGAWWPKEDVGIKPYEAWVPKRGLRFDELVDLLSVKILARRSTAKLLTACVEATGVRPGERVTRAHPVAQWRFPLLMATILDSPAHLAR